MVRGIVAAAHEIVQRHVEVVREGDEGVRIGFALSSFIILISS